MRVRAADVIGLAVVAAAIGVRIAVSPTPVGLDGDDGSYLATGLRFFAPSAPGIARSWAAGPEGSPLYQLWYFGWSQLEPEPLRLLRVSWAALVVLNVTLAWSLMRVLGAGPLIATVAACALCSLRVLQVEPLVSALAAAIVVAGVLAGANRSKSVGLAAVSTALGVASFVRPELALAFLASLPLLAVAAVRERSPAAAVPLLVVATLCIAIGVPVGSARAPMAFGQHYMLNVTTAEGRAPEWQRWREYLRRDFGAEVTPAGALRSNPARLAWHVRRNISHLRSAAYVLCPPWLPPRSGAAAVFAIVIAAATGYGLWSCRAASRAGDSGAMLGLTALALLALPLAASAVLIYPREHYFVPAALLALVLAAAHGPRGRAHPLAHRARAKTAPRRVDAAGRSARQDAI